MHQISVCLSQDLIQIKCMADRYITAVYLVFRFLTGGCSSAFLSVAGGSISDMWDNHHIGTPMAIYTGSPFIGPVLGPIVGGFINQVIKCVAVQISNFD